MKKKEALSPEEMQRLLHELRLHQTELEQQNVELRRPQEELEASRSRYVDFYNQAPVGYFTISEKGLIMEANLTAAAMLGTACGALTRQPFSRFIDPEDQNVFYRLRSRLFDTREPQFCDIRMLRANGTLLWARVNATTSRLDGDTGPLFCRIVMSDITELKQIEDMLRASEQRYRLLAENSLQGIALLSGFPPVFVYVNPRWTVIFGYSAEEALSFGPDEMWKLVHPEDRHMVRQRNADRLMGKTAISIYEFRIIRKDGSTGWVEVFASKILSECGAMMSQANYVDITERKLTEEALQDSEERFRAAFQGSPAALSITTQDGGIWIDANQAELDMFGYTREEIIGKSALEKGLWVDQQDRQHFIDALDQNKEARNPHVSLRHKDGRLIIAAVSAKSLTLKGVKHILFATEDITERIQSEEQIKESLREKEILLREIHHRVKNNLAVVSSLLGLQTNRIKDHDAKNMMDASRQRIKSMALVHEKMYCAQQLSIVDFSDYINSIVQELTSSCHQEKRNITTQINAHGILLDIETATPCGLIINELITNAMKHAFTGTISPELRIGFEKEDNTFTMTVQDNGIGLPDGFSSLSTNTLGLLLVRALTRQLRGTVQFHSDTSVRQGTTVTFTFPKTDKKTRGSP